MRLVIAILCLMVAYPAQAKTTTEEKTETRVKSLAVLTLLCPLCTVIAISDGTATRIVSPKTTTPEPEKSSIKRNLASEKKEAK